MSYKIGIDGGGTKTECLLIDGAGAVVARHLAPGCNPSVIGAEKAGLVVRSALDALIGAGGPSVRGPAGRGSPPIDITLLCMAGNRALWSSFAASLAGFGRVTATDDSLPVLELATAGGPGLVLHAGTGSFVAARTETGAITDAHYAGGLGFRFGDPGSGYDIGRRAIARAATEMQGWVAPSGLGALVRESTGAADADGILRFFYGDPAPNPKIAALAPAVLQLAAAGDRTAHALIVDSVSELLELAVRVAAKLFPGAPARSLRAGLSGPILTHPIVVSALEARSPLILKPIEGSPIEGVRRLLVRI